MRQKKFLLVLIPAALAGVLAARFALGPEDGAAAPAPPPAEAAAIAPAPMPLVQPAAAANAAMPRAGSEMFRLVDGRIDAHLQSAPLPAAVARIARAAAVELVGSERLADVPVRVDLDGVPVAEALLRLTAGYNSAFEYRGARLARMSITPEPAVRADETAAAANLDQLEPQQRGDAIEAIAAHGGDRAREVVSHALSDADEEVRLRALEQTQVVQGLALPVDALQDLLLRDASENVRFKALDVLATDPAVDAYALATIARGAESDRSELVRSKAAELREQLEAASGPPTQ
ncbi:MAG TPA: hypothetical protein VNX47_12150 [Nevskia sp.]|nr:hypothetical protein [Nevskia sp.]